MFRAPAITALAAALAALATPAAPRAEVQGSLTATVGPGYDSNPGRTLGAEATPDGFLSLSAAGKGKVRLGESGRLQGRYDLGLRKFFRVQAEDVAVQQLALGGCTALGRALLGVDAAGKWRASRSRERDYKDLAADLYLDWAFSRRLSARVSLGAHGFLYQLSDYDYVAPQAAVGLRWQPLRRHVFNLGLFGALPYYRGRARYWNADDHSFSEVRRRDRTEGGQLSYAYRGPVAVQGGYALARSDSNSYGEANERHRLFAAVGARLPGRLFVSAQLAWQFLRYPEGVFLTSEDLLLLDEESQSSAGLKLAFAATDNLDLEARYSLFWVALPSAQDIETGGTAMYWRHTAFVALTFRM